MRQEVVNLLSVIGKRNAKTLESHIYDVIFPEGEETDDGIDAYQNIMYNFVYIFESSTKEDAIRIANIVMEAENKEDIEKAMYSNHSQLEENQKMRDEYITNPIIVEEGVMNCPECGSNRTHSTQKQVRSADEGFTTFCSCANPKCRHKWRIN